MSTNQTFKVSGELEVVSLSGSYEANNALISFKTANNLRLCSIRSYGSGPYNFMLIDATQCLGGLELRGTTDEGSSTIGGKGDYMSFTVREGKCGAKFMVIKQYPFVNNGFTQMYGYPNLEVYRQDARDAFSLTNAIADFSQSNWKAGESMVVSLGFNRNSGACYWGYSTPTGNSSDASNTAYIGMLPSYNNLKKNLVFENSGDTYTDYKFKASTIEATNWIGLPPTPAGDLLPLTLDVTNNRVGINQTTPTQALDVVGNAYVSGNLATGGAISAGTVNVQGTNAINIANDGGDPNVSFRIDGNNNQLSIIARSGPGASSAANMRFMTAGAGAGETVAMDIQTGGSVVTYFGFQSQGNITSVNGRLYVGPGAAQVSIHGNTTDPEGVATGVSGALYLRRSATATNRVFVKTTDSGTTGWIPLLTNENLPVQSLLPITLDTMNNRVGINQTTPTQALDVDGTIKASSNIQCTGLNSSTLTTTSNVTVGGRLSIGTLGNLAMLLSGTTLPADAGVSADIAPAGSIYMRTGEGNTDQLFVKEQESPPLWTPVYTSNNVPAPQIGSTVLVKLAADTAVTANTTNHFQSFILPTAGVWEITIAYRMNPATVSPGIFYFNTIGPSETSTVYPNIGIKLAFNAYATNGPNFMTLLFTTDAPSMVVYWNVNTGQNATFYANATYAVATYKGVLP